MTPKHLPPYPPTTILVVEVGSTAHGTGLPGGEDHDETAIWVESVEDVFALRDYEKRAISQRTKPNGVPSEPGDTDRNIYTLRHFLSLAASGNPSILLVLWAPVILRTPIGTDLRNLAPAFVGRHLIPRYRGYMKAQVDRLLGLRGGRHGAFREDATGIGYDTKYAMHAARLGFQGIELLRNRGLVLPIPPPAGDWLRSVRHGDVSRDDWAARVQSLDDELVALAGDSSIPETADRERIVGWSATVHRRVWRKGL